MTNRLIRRPALLDLAALSIVGFVGLLVGLALAPTTTSGPQGSARPSGVAGAPSPAGAPIVTTGPAPSRSQPPAGPVRPWACEVPEQLPSAPIPLAAPRVGSRNLAVAFTSYLYERSPGGRLFAQDSDAKHGLWFAAPGQTEARLLMAADGGAVLPLGLSADGDTVAVWYLSEARGWDDRDIRPCESGIYLLSTIDGTSRLVMQRDWRVVLDDSGVGMPNDRIGRSWPAGQTDAFDTVVHQLPEAAFSADGRSVALVERELITVVGPGRDGHTREHSGECSSWAWSPHGATFVAGCEQMTSAWSIDVELGYDENFYPLPRPKGEDLSRTWERWWAATIGFTTRADIRLVRFFGFATGCEASPCSIPRPYWTDTTIKPISGRMTSRVTEIAFLTDVNEVGRDARMSADGSWLYIRTSPSYSRTSPSARARTIAIASGAIVEVQRLANPVGTSGDGRFLFESRLDGERDVVVIRSLDRLGEIRDVGTIAWPDGAETDEAIIDAFGLAVAWVPG